MKNPVGTNVPARTENPRIRFVHGEWRCATYIDSLLWARGDTPKEAYDNWLRWLS